jgi:hypothetical protein
MLAPTYGLSELTDKMPCSERLEKVDERPAEHATRVVIKMVTRTRESATWRWVDTGELRIFRPSKTGFSLVCVSAALGVLSSETPTRTSLYPYYLRTVSSGVMIRQEEIHPKTQNLLMFARFILRASTKGVCGQEASSYHKSCETLGDNL